MLPSIPHKQTKRTQEIVAFRGMNRTQNTQDGDLSDATNLSTAQYPTITQRGKRTLVHKTTTPAVTDYSNPTDIYAWDGHLVVVDDGVLYYDGEALDNVSDGLKQFAVVNTKLCIWPDKTYIDLTNGSYGHLDASMQTSGQASSITIADGKKFTASLTAKTATGLTFTQRSGYGVTYTYTYGSNTSSFIQCWHDGAWDMSMLAQRQSKVSVTGGGISVGSIFIPSKNGNSYSIVTAGPYAPADPDTSRYNTAGYYGIVTNVQTWQEYDDWAGITLFCVTVTFDVYNATQIVQYFSDAFQVGDSVSISGTKNGTADVKHAIIRSIDSPNTLVFDTGTFSVPSGYDTSTYVVTIQRDVPSLDYICEKDNRLWGVSNSQENSIWNPDTQSYDTFTSRAIYASALGDPTNFWVFDGLDSDAYQVAVGSEGDFTGICSYGNGVCCWKEDTLHKILGSYPSEYYMHTSHIEGVANGSYRSLTIVNEVLYYNGATGIYAYTGSTPSLIGYPLGTLYTNASGGSNGLRWYLSGTKPDGTTELVVYDLTHRVWTREDDAEAVAFAMIGSNVYMLIKYSNTVNRIWLVEQGNDPDIEWSGEFVPFDETALIRKHYLRIALRLDMAAGSHVTVEVSKDNGTFQTLLNEDAVAAKAKVVQIPPNRVDRFTVRVSGTGNVRIREFMREYIQGSERP